MFFKIDLRDKDSGGHYGLLDWIYPRQALISQGVGLLITLTYIAAWRRVMCGQAPSTDLRPMS